MKKRWRRDKAESGKVGQNECTKTQRVEKTRQLTYSFLASSEISK